MILPIPQKNIFSKKDWHFYRNILWLKRREKCLTERIIPARKFRWILLLSGNKNFFSKHICDKQFKNYTNTKELQKCDAVNIKTLSINFNRISYNHINYYYFFIYSSVCTKQNSGKGSSSKMPVQSETAQHHQSDVRRFIQRLYGYGRGNLWRTVTGQLVHNSVSTGLSHRKKNKIVACPALSSVNAAQIYDINNSSNKIWSPEIWSRLYFAF